MSGCTLNRMENSRLHLGKLTLVMFPTCIWEVPVSNIGQNTNSPYVIHGFSQLFQANVRILPYMNPLTFPSISFQFIFIQSLSLCNELLTVLLNELGCI